MKRMIKVINENLTVEEKKSFLKWKNEKNIVRQNDFYDMFLWAKATYQKRILGLLELATMLDTL